MSFPAYPSYQESGLVWLGQVPSHWYLKRLAHYFDERRTKVSDKDFPPLSVTKNGILPQLETAAKTDDGDNRKLVRAGDFVINSRSDRKGSSGLSELDGSTSLINTVLEPSSEIDGRFAHHLFRSVSFQEEYYRVGKGIVADLWSTNFSEMRNIVLAVPPVSEQAAIAAFLDRETANIDALVEEQRRLIELLKEKRQAVISHVVTKGLDPAVSMKDSGVEWLGEVPAHWRVIPLKREINVLSGYAFPSAGFKTAPEQTPLLRGVNIAVGRMRWDDVVYWQREDNDGLDEYELQAGDIVLGMDRPWIGDGLRVAQVSHDDLPCLLLQRVAALRPSSAIIPEYIPHLLAGEAFHHHCVPEMTGVSVPHISPSQIGSFVVALPPVDEQRLILPNLSRACSAIQLLLEAIDENVALLLERRACVISAAVTGQIDVRDVEAIKAEAA